MRFEGFSAFMIPALSRHYNVADFGSQKSAHWGSTGQTGGKGREEKSPSK